MPCNFIFDRLILTKLPSNWFVFISRLSQVTLQAYLINVIAKYQRCLNNLLPPHYFIVETSFKLHVTSNTMNYIWQQAKWWIFWSSYSRDENRKLGLFLAFKTLHFLHNQNKGKLLVLCISTSWKRSTKHIYTKVICLLDIK